MIFLGQLQWAASDGRGRGPVVGTHRCEGTRPHSTMLAEAEASQVHLSLFKFYFILF